MFVSGFTIRRGVIQSSRARLCVRSFKARPPTSITVHILHDNTLTQDNRDKFIYLTGRYGQAVKFYNVDELCANKINHIKKCLLKNSFYNIGATYRLLVSEILPNELEKIIYLDSDIIVNLDINELWQFELDDKILAVIPEILNRGELERDFALCREGLVKNEDYFNSGVLPMNLTILRNEENIVFNWLEILEKNPQYARFADQDTLNYYFSTRTLKLPVKFNRFVISSRREHETRIEKMIYHFATSAFSLDMHDPFNRLWMKYFMKTPWFDEDSIGRLYEGVEQMHGGLKSSMLNLSAMMSGKTCAFFVTPQDVDMIKKSFSVQKSEDIILAENQESIKKLIKAMKRSQGKKIFFITMLIFPYNVLINEGFVFGKDFLNGAEFLLGFNSYSLIKDM